MPVPGGHQTTGAPAAKALAFYLPQYYPIPENDEWWGKGFTEWSNVTRARPLYPGHYQPHVPGELGYYDLRLPEVREAQAALAREHGLTGFIYYHYWFNGRRLLERPFDEVLATGSPDFPFALCWANEEWTRNWDGKSGHVLMPQHYDPEDDVAHLRWLAKAFADPRYITIDGKPLFLVYRPGDLPEPRRTTDRWRAEAQKLGFPDLYLAWAEAWGQPPGGPEANGFDATVDFMPRAQERLFTPLESVRGHRIVDYSASAEAHLDRPAPHWRRIPSVMVGWDNTARRPRGATIFDGATPENYRRWLERTVASIADVREEERLLVILAWNEWAEGNHLEPDQHFGRGFLEATQKVLLGGPNVTQGEPTAQGVTRPLAEAQASYSDTFALAARLLPTISVDHRLRVVDLGPDPLRFAAACRVLDVAYEPIAVTTSPTPEAMGQSAEFEKTAQALDELGDVGAVVLLDGIQRIAEPHRFLAALSRWALTHGEPALVISVPNVAHFDRGLRLLCGEWSESDAPSRDMGDLHQFTAVTLRRLLERSGWIVAANDDFESVRSELFDEDLENSIPEEMAGALRVLSETYNPQWAVREFVWALTPISVTSPPRTFGEAIAPDEDEVRKLPGPWRHPVEDYLASIGIVASEINRRGGYRRGLYARRPRRLRWKESIYRVVSGAPGGSALVKSIRKPTG
jgi:hypothetical protein